jgi:septum formation protein
MLESAPIMVTNGNHSILLASASPRRNELLALTGWQCLVRPAAIDESPVDGEDGTSMARRLAETKARAAAQDAGGAAFVLTADTVVLDGELILGKPADEADARRMLFDLRGRTHRVVTAIALLAADTGEVTVDACETTVPMRTYTDTEMDAYVRSGGAGDKAGAYGIQDNGFRPVAMSSFHGCYANVMGLPLCHLVRAMRRLGCEPPADVPEACQRHNAYACDVFVQVLGGEG